jgi:hypothetical protein
VRTLWQKIKHEFTKTFIRGNEVPFGNGFIPGRFHEQSRVEKWLVWVKANAAVFAVIIGFVSLLVSLFK